MLYYSTINDLLKNSLYQNLTFSSLREYLRYEDKNSMRFSILNTPQDIKDGQCLCPMW